MVLARDNVVSGKRKSLSTLPAEIKVWRNIFLKWKSPTVTFISLACSTHHFFLLPSQWRVSNPSSLELHLGQVFLLQTFACSSDQNCLFMLDIILLCSLLYNSIWVVKAVRVQTPPHHSLWMATVSVGAKTIIQIEKSIKWIKKFLYEAIFCHGQSR